MPEPTAAQLIEQRVRAMYAQSIADKVADAQAQGDEFDHVGYAQSLFTTVMDSVHQEAFGLLFRA